MTDKTYRFTLNCAIRNDRTTWNATARAINVLAQTQEQTDGLLQSQTMTHELYETTGYENPFVPAAPPVALPAAPTGTQVTIYNHFRGIYLEQKKIVNAFKQALIDAMDAEVLIMLTGPQRNIRLETLSISDIMNTLRDKIGKLRPEDLVALELQLTTEFDPYTMDLNTYLTTYHDTVHVALQEAEQAPNEFKKVKYLENALKPCGFFKETIARYRGMHPDVDQVRWDTFCEVVRATEIELPVTTAASAGFDAASAVMEMEDPHSYCYLHGQCFHRSANCSEWRTIPPQFMNDTLATTIDGNKNVARPRPAWMSLASKGARASGGRGGAGRGGGRGGATGSGAGRGGAGRGKGKGGKA